MTVWNSRRIIKSKVGRKMAETEKQKDIYILGIESSCDETAASVVKNGREVLSNVISSQISTNNRYWRRNNQGTWTRNDKHN